MSIIKQFSYIFNTSHNINYIWTKLTFPIPCIMFAFKYLYNEYNYMWLSEQKPT